MYISLLLVSVTGDGQFGEKSASDVAGEYMEAGKQNLHKFCSPRISFVFFDGITESVAGGVSCKHCI